MANRFLNNIRINDEYTLPSTDGTENQIIVTDGAGNLSFNDLGTVTGTITGVESNLTYYEVKNSSGAQILKGKGVMAVGTDGNSGHILIDEMVADGSVEARYFLGVLSENLDNGSIGRVIAFGELDQFNTTGQNGETWTGGQVLWCDPDSAGDFTTTEPDGPNVKIPAAFILKASTNGKIQVRVQANEGIHQLHDTKITTQADGELLVWNNTLGVWQNDGTATVDYTNGRVGIGTSSPAVTLHLYDAEAKINFESSYGRTSSIQQGGGYFMINSDNVNGVSINYQATNRGKLTLFNNTTDAIRLDASGYTYFNGGNVGIGTTAPGANLEIRKSASDGIGPVLRLRADDSNDGNPEIQLYRGTGSTVGSSIWLSNGNTDLYFDNRYAGSSTFGRMFFRTQVAGTPIDALTIMPGGNIGVGTTTPDSKLEVAGSVHVAGNSATRLDLDAEVRITGQYNVNSGNEFTYLRMYNGGNASINIGTKHSLGYISFESGNGSYVERMRITNTGNVGIGTTSPGEKLHVAGNVTADEYKYNSVERVESKNWKYVATVAAGYYEELGQWRVTEGNAVLRITVQSNTSGNSGTAVYILQGGFNQAADGWFELLPAFKGGGHGNAQDGWKVLWYDDSSYTYKLAVGVPSGLANKTLHVSVELLGNPNSDSYYQYTALSTTGAIPSYSLDRTTSYSHRDLVSSDSITAQYDAANYTTLGYDSLNTYGGSQVFKIAGAEKMRIASNGKVGIGTTSPGYTLQVEGAAKFASPVHVGSVTNAVVSASGVLNLSGFKMTINSSTGAVGMPSYGSGTFTGTATQRLAVDSSGNVIEIPIGSGPVDGSGTANYVTKWSDADTITNSSIYDNGSQVIVNGTSSAFSDKLYLHNTSGYAVSGWRVGTTTTYVGKVYNYSGVLALEADGTRSLSLKNTTNGEIVRIDGANSKVGIGTTSPLAKLDVISPDGSTHSLRLGRVDNGNYWHFNHAGNDLRISNSAGAGSDILLGVDSGSTDQGNRVGIGTATPAYRLDVNGTLRTVGNTYLQADTYIGTSTSAYMQFNRAGYNYIAATEATGAMVFRTGGSSNRMIIDPSGKVGIGLTNPSQQLHVSGNAYVNSRLSVGTQPSPWTTAVIAAEEQHTTGTIAGTDALLDLYNSWESDTDEKGAILTFSDNYFDGVNYNRTTRAAIKGGTDSTGNTANGFLAFYTDSSSANSAEERMRINKDGNVGIGTSSPSEKLHVNGTFRSNAFWTNSSAVSYWGNGTTAYGGLTWSTGYATVFSQAGNVLHLGAGGASPDMTITTTGYVGIGTTSPSATLDVVGNIKIGNNATVFSDGSITLDIDYNNNQTDRALRVTQHGATNELFRVQEDGNVGIGTATPATKLDVNGNIKMTETAATTDTDKIVVSDSGVLKYRTGAQILSDIGGQASISAPNAPTNLSLTVVGNTIDVTFTASTTSDIDAYLVYSSVDGSDYGLISIIPPDDFSATMSIIDDAFSVSGTQAYRVYAMKLGNMSTALTGSISYTVSTPLEPTNMSVVPLNTAYFVQWDPPSSNARFVTAYNVYKHEAASQASLARASATLVYSGMNTNYMYQISGANNTNYHQFWVETTVA